MCAPWGCREAPHPDGPGRPGQTPAAMQLADLRAARRPSGRVEPCHLHIPQGLTDAVVDLSREVTCSSRAATWVACTPTCSMLGPARAAPLCRVQAASPSALPACLCSRPESEPSSLSPGPFGAGPALAAGLLLLCPVQVSAGRLCALLVPGSALRLVGSALLYC